MDTTFPHEYECKQLHELPGGSPQRHFYYPGGSSAGGADGLLVRIQPENDLSWSATFAFSSFVRTPIAGIFTMPDPQRFCVVASGAGYLVSANDPALWEPVDADPIIDVRPIHSHGIIVFANFTSMVAYGKSGVAWRTKRLSFDSLRITEVTGKFIIGEYWDIRIEGMSNFVVDLSTGTSEGGVGEF
jgi:hypothetical protein